MKFGPVPLDQAEGTILAHSLKVAGQMFRKGQILSAADLDVIRQDCDQVTVAKLDAGDISENEAARDLATAIKGANLRVAEAFTGRANLLAETAGVLRINADVQAINSVDEAITLATLPDYARVDVGQMVATVKIIPYAVPLAQLETVIKAASGAMDLHPFKLSSASLILTETPSLKKSLTEKAENTLRKRLTALGIDAVDVVIVDHKIDAVRDAIQAANGQTVLILGGSATSDKMDVCPAALVAARGTVHRFGMPVDPGNLLFIGELDETPVIGLPGCVRSPALNGADWVLERVVAGLDVSATDIAAMGVGGLLKEIPTRPQPRMRK